MGRHIPLLELCRYYGTTDVHRARAAHEFGVPAEAVTNTQRQLAKDVNWFTLYGGSPLWEVYSVTLRGIEQ